MCILGRDPCRDRFALRGDRTDAADRNPGQYQHEFIAHRRNVHLYGGEPDGVKRRSVELDSR